jgi:hypothetical protein
MPANKINRALRCADPNQGSAGATGTAGLPDGCASRHLTHSFSTLGLVIMVP